MPDITPDADPTVTTPVALLLQAPPVAPSTRVVVEPMQTVEGPEIEGVDEFTVTTVVAVQPVRVSV